jgi:hypothetical protein
MKMVISRGELAAALLFVSSDEDRYVLTGIQFEAGPNHPPKLIATDGRRLVVIETKAEQAEIFHENFTMILQPHYASAIIKLSRTCGAKMFPWICFEIQPPKPILNLTLIGAGVSMEIIDGALIEGQYPDWRRSLPLKTDGREPITDLGLNASYIGDFATAAKKLEAESVGIQMNLIGKEKSVEVKINGVDNFYGLVMQCKLNENVNYQPEFLEIISAIPKPEPKEQNED